MGTYRYVVSLRVSHPTKMPEEICNVLKMEPRYKWAVGAPRETPKGAPLKGIYDSTYCSFRLDHAKEVGLAQFLRQCNKTLGAHRDFFRQIRLTGGSSEYFVGWYSKANSGELFTAELLKELADLQIDLGLDVNAEAPPAPKLSKKASRTRKNVKAKNKK